MRVRRTLLNFGTAALLMAVNLVVAFPASRLLVAWLGVRRYGGFRVVNEASGYLTLLELGLGGAILPLLARAVGRDDEEALHETLTAGSRAYVKLVLVTIVVGLALTPLIPRFASDLVGDEVTDLRCGWVVGLTSYLTLVLLPMRTLVEARQLGYVINLLLTAQSLLMTGTSLFMAWALGRTAWGITGQAAAMVFAILTFHAVITTAVLRRQPGLLRSILTRPTCPETRRALRTLSGPTLLINLCSRVSVLSDNLIVGGVLGTEKVTSLYLTQRLTNVGQMALQAVGGSSWAALAELHAQGEHDTFNRRLVEMTRIVAVLAVVGLVPVVAYNRAFIRLWMGPNFHYAGDTVTTLSAVNAVLLAELMLGLWCFMATGKNRHVVPALAAAAVVNVVTSVAMTYKVGLSGPVIGTTVAFVAVELWLVPWRLHRTFGTPVGALARAFVVPFSSGAAAAWALRALTLHHQPAGWAGLATEMSLAALGMLAFSLAFLLTPEDRALWRLRFHALRAAKEAGPGAEPGVAAVAPEQGGMTL